jgi:hypothetical protein
LHLPFTKYCRQNHLAHCAIEAIQTMQWIYIDSLILLRGDAYPLRSLRLHHHHHHRYQFRFHSFLRSHRTLRMAPVLSHSSLHNRGTPGMGLGPLVSPPSPRQAHKVIYHRLQRKDFMPPHSHVPIEYESRPLSTLISHQRRSVSNIAIQSRKSSVRRTFGSHLKSTVVERNLKSIPLAALL